jgi:peptidase C25-like protein
MKNSNSIDRPGSSRQTEQSGARAARVLIISLCLVILTAAAALPSGFAARVSAAIQQAAKRTVTPAPKPKPGAPVVRQSKEAQLISQGKVNADGTITPDQIITDNPIQRTTAELMADEASRPAQSRSRMMKPEFEHDRDNIPDGPGAIAASQWPLPDKNAPTPQLGAPQTLGTQFDGATGPSETGAFPPDTMGAVGPTQFVVFLNGRLRTFNKTTGVADAVINVDSDVFFASVITPPGVGEVAFTSDPMVRFDRLSNRWFLVIIDVVLNAATGATTKANRVLIAVNDAASNGVISGATIWTFYQFQGDATLFTDYESLGIDASALYIGGNMFTLAGTFNSTKGFVIPKAPALTASPLTVWAFSGLVATPTGAGPYTPRGVDNYNPANTGVTAEGYFIGVDNATFNTLMLRRVTNPGSLGPAPTISANISIATPLTTRFPVLVPHLGNTGGTGGRLDALDDRLFSAHIRNGRLWTAHSIGVNNTGVAGATNNRNACRWYELQNIITPGTPSVLQSGTLFDNNVVNDANQRNYWITTIMVSGQGHAALGCSIGGTNERVNAFTTGRLVGDTLGTLRDGPGGIAFPGYTASATAYNPPGDPGGPSRRWGDYSYTSLDPKDDMTMWTIQQYCNGTNTYGVRAVKLIAPPPPPTNTSNPGAIQLNNPSTNLVITGTALAGQGFYDPGPNPAAPHTTFNHLTAVGTGITVNSITFNTPTQVSMNVSTVGSTPGSKTITITNPDGQTTTVQVLVGPTAAKVTSFTADSFDDGRVLLRWSSSHEVDNLGYNVYREVNGQRTKINPQTIAGSALVTGPGVALTAGKSYVWGDQLTQAGTRYLLEDIDLTGKSNWTGPISLSAKIGRAPSVEESVLLTRIGLASAQVTNGQGSVPVERKAEIASTTAATMSVQSDLASQPAVKLGVTQEGWYHINQPALAAAGLSTNGDPRNLQLYVDGRQVPMIVNGELDGRFDTSDSIEFYGVGLNSAATNSHTYWVVAGGQKGARIKTFSTAGNLNAPGSFTTSVERKDRTLYFSGLRNGETENFFGPVVASTAVDQSLTLTNIASTSSSAALEVHLQGVTLTPHQVRVTFNGTEVGTVNFNGQQRGKASFPISQTQLLAGVNSVQLIALGGSTDISLVDTLRVTYAHTLTADSNQLRAGVRGGQPATIGGFTSSDIRVMDVTDQNNPQELTGTILGSKNNARISLTPPGVGTRLLLAFTGARAMSAAAKANIPSNWHEEGLQNDYVMITTQGLKASLNPLKALREGQGLSVAVADVEDLYDEFSFGNKSPQAIKDFLRFTRDNWRRMPRFVLFAGDSSFDPKNYLGYGDVDLVPTKLFDSDYMEAATDDWFVDFQSTGLPDIATGRLPVRNAAEAAALVGKILSYENSTTAGSVLLTSDLNDGYDFAAGNAVLRSLLPGGMQVEEVLRGSSDDATVKSQILAAINQGKTVVNYNGHGSVDQWRGNILTNADAATMTNNQKLTFFVMMTCLNGYFDDPVLDSLAEALLKSTGGAAAVWASTAQCLPTGQEVVNQELYRLLFEGGSITIGEATARAKQAVTDGDVRRSWILFGDPAMHLK